MLPCTQICMKLALFSLYICRNGTCTSNRMNSMSSCNKWKLGKYHKRLPIFGSSLLFIYPWDMIAIQIRAWVGSWDKHWKIQHKDKYCSFILMSTHFSYIVRTILGFKNLQEIVKFCTQFGSNHNAWTVRSVNLWFAIRLCWWAVKVAVKWAKTAHKLIWGSEPLEGFGNEFKAHVLDLC